MSFELKQLQQSFFTHLLKQPSDIADYICSTPDRTAEQRLHIYATGYRLRLKEAISTDFDKLFSYLGDDLFEQLMDAYINTYQSHHPSLRYYSQNMRELLRTQAPFLEHPETLELAMIEEAFNNSFDAAGCTTFEIAQLTEIPAEKWGTLCIQFHASLELLELNKNSFDIWKALANEEEPAEAVDRKNVWIIWRKDLISRYRPVNDVEAQMLKLAINNANFTELCEAMSSLRGSEQAPMQVMTLLQTWVNEKIVCQLQ